MEIATNNKAKIITIGCHQQFESILPGDISWLRDERSNCQILRSELKGEIKYGRWNSYHRPLSKSPYQSTFFKIDRLLSTDRTGIQMVCSYLDWITRIKNSR